MKSAFCLGVMLLALGAFAPARSIASAPAPAAPTSHAGQGYLGVDLRDITDDQAALLKQKDTRGAEIVLVDHDAPAGKAGLHEHDIILRINGQSIPSQDQARRILRDCPPSSSVTLFVSRSGQFMTITAHMSTRDEVERQAMLGHIPVPEPSDPPQSEAFAAPSQQAAPSGSTPRLGNSFIGSILMTPSYTGAMLEQLSTQLAQFFGASSGTGLLVRSVAENSPAAQAGLHAGDVVTRANDRPVATTSDWMKAVKNSHGRPITVTVLRDKREQTLTLTPDGKKRSSLEELITAPEKTLVAHVGWLNKP
jgi:S1-C subfamily serine protease